VPLIGFWWLHFNIWYAYGLLPLTVIAVGKILKSLPTKLAYLFIILLIINSAIKLYGFIWQEKAFLSQHKGFLTTKMKVINYIYQQSEGKSFSSYQYAPEIYDYGYQYLYLWQGFKGKPLPMEFSYQPNAPTYANEKADLLTILSPKSAPQERIFLIIEKPENVWHYPLQSWLNNIHFKEIVSQKDFGPELEVWEVQ